LSSYLNRVQSRRRLEREAGRNVEVMWLLGRLAPDHKTIADFRKDNGWGWVYARFVDGPVRLAGSGLAMSPLERDEGPNYVARRIASV
jgi:hypothetical protein